MSIGKRLFNMARSELNALLERATEAEPQASSGRDPDEDLYRRFILDELTDVELEAEIERRYRARQAAKGSDARSGAGSSAGPRSTNRAGTARAPGAGPARKSAPPDELRLAYAALEVPYGTDFATVRKSYRALMRKYHPDRHAGSPDKQKAATELAQKLSAAYALIEQREGK
jgi:DnaJ-domain-containing protein 1